MLLLSGCAKVHGTVTKIQLPSFPTPSTAVGKEISEVCSTRMCDRLALQINSLEEAGTEYNKEVCKLLNDIYIYMCDKNKCKNLYNWTNQLYTFDKVYKVYKTELAK